MSDTEFERDYDGEEEDRRLTRQPQSWAVWWNDNSSTMKNVGTMLLGGTIMAVAGYFAYKRFSGSSGEGMEE